MHANINILCIYNTHIIPYMKKYIYSIIYTTYICIHINFLLCLSINNYMSISSYFICIDMDVNIDMNINIYLF